MKTDALIIIAALIGFGLGISVAVSLSHAVRNGYIIGYTDSRYTCSKYGE